MESPPNPVLSGLSLFAAAQEQIRCYTRTYFKILTQRSLLVYRIPVGMALLERVFNYVAAFTGLSPVDYCSPVGMAL